MRMSKTQLDKLIKEELEHVLREKAAESRIDEIALPGVGWVLTSYRWINEALKLASRTRFLPQEVRPLVEELAEASQRFVDAMNKFYEEHPKLYSAVIGPIAAMDPAGTATAKAKEIVLRNINNKLASETEDEQKQIGLNNP